MDLVRNHMCEGLAIYQQRFDQGSQNYRPFSDCVPRFDAAGHTVGCDDTNYNAILYCPFCGTKLDEDLT